MVLNSSSLSDLYSAAVGFARRQFSTIVFAVLCCLALGAVYLFTATPLFTAHAVLVIDTHKAQPWQTISPLGDMPLDLRASIRRSKSSNRTMSHFRWSRTCTLMRIRNSSRHGQASLAQLWDSLVTLLAIRYPFFSLQIAQRADTRIANHAGALWALFNHASTLSV